MISRKISRALSVALGAFAFSFCAITAEAKLPKSTAQHSAQSASKNDDALIREQVLALENYLAKGDTVGLSNMWTIDGNYVDEDGNEFKGRTDLVKRFSKVFLEAGPQRVQLVPEEIRLLSSNVGTVDGVVRRKDEEKAPPQTRYTMVFVKQKGTWLISSATETPIESAEEPSHDTLNDLSWLIGDWKSERNGASVNMRADWTIGKNFIRCDYLVKKPDAPPVMYVQVIGFDPRKEQLISWNFDASGGFGSGVWFKKDKKWIVESVATERDGSSSRAINVIEPKDPNSFLWQSVNRSVDGVALADMGPLTVERVTH
jgi:uncharacterized protein (TIGR02246 family)